MSLVVTRFHDKEATEDTVAEYQGARLMVAGGRQQRGDLRRWVRKGFVEKHCERDALELGGEPLQARAVLHHAMLGVVEASARFKDLGRPDHLKRNFTK